MHPNFVRLAETGSGVIRPLFGKALFVRFEERLQDGIGRILDQLGKLADRQRGDFQVLPHFHPAVVFPVLLGGVIDHRPRDHPRVACQQLVAEQIIELLLTHIRRAEDVPKLVGGQLVFGHPCNVRGHHGIGHHETEAFGLQPHEVSPDDIVITLGFAGPFDAELIHADPLAQLLIVGLLFLVSRVDRDQHPGDKLIDRTTFHSQFRQLHGRQVAAGDFDGDLVGLDVSTATASRKRVHKHERKHRHHGQRDHPNPLVLAKKCKWRILHHRNPESRVLCCK